MMTSRSPNLLFCTCSSLLTRSVISPIISSTSVVPRTTSTTFTTTKSIGCIIHRASKFTTAYTTRRTRMSMMNKDMNEKLLSIPSICARCRLRAKNDRTPSHYLILKTSADEQQQQLEPEIPCRVCLGILQESSLKEITSKLSSKLKPIQHDGNFKINSTIPPSILVIRDRAFRLYLSSFSSSNNSTFNIVSLREAFKWSLTTRLEHLFNLTYSQQAQLFLDVLFTHHDSSHDVSFIAEKHPPPKARRRYESAALADSTNHITRVVENMTNQQFIDTLPENWMPPPESNHFVQVNTRVSTASVFFAGFYNKWSRIVSQTPWFLNDDDDNNNNNNNERNISKQQQKQRTAVNVEDAILNGVRTILRPDKASFSAGGREDVDVRMLGTGRPFLVEVTNPCIIASQITSSHVSKIIDQLSTSSQHRNAVSISNFRIVNHQFGARMKAVETEKRKKYRCVIWCAQSMTREEISRRIQTYVSDSGPDGLILKQRTPLRVLHRRTQTVRDRRIYAAEITQMISPNFFVLDVSAQAGTYIKEFVHGDYGRTVPSVSSLLECDVDIIQLDVVLVDNIQELMGEEDENLIKDE